MKSTILKAFALPLAAFALASAGAVTTVDAGTSKKAVLIDAYIHNPNLDDCKPVKVDCVQGPGQLCTSGSYEAFQMDNNDECNIQLRRP